MAAAGAAPWRALLRPRPRLHPAARACRPGPPAGRRAAASGAEASEGRRRLYPPGADAPKEKAVKFAGLVSECLSQGLVVELRPVGAAATRHSLRALCAGSAAAEFQVSWEAADAAAGPGDARGAGAGTQGVVRLEAQRGGAWAEEARRDTAQGFFVGTETQVVQLAKKVSMELRKGQQVALNAYLDADIAISILLKALATEPRLRGSTLPLRCTAGSRHGAMEDARVVVHARMDAEVSEASASDFIAYPPGRDADPDLVRRFRQSVHERLRYDWAVVMECRGGEAVAHAMNALASFRDKRAAQFEVRWVESRTTGAGPDVARALRLRATRAEAWEDFNSIDFKKTQKLGSGEKSDVTVLARTVGFEVKNRGGVAVHAHWDNTKAVFTAVKALASVAVEHGGLRTATVPSFGFVKATGSGDRLRMLRLYTRPRQQADGAQAGAGGARAARPRAAGGARRTPEE